MQFMISPNYLGKRHNGNLFHAIYPRLEAVEVSNALGELYPSFMSGAEIADKPGVDAKTAGIHQIEAALAFYCSNGWIRNPHPPYLTR